MAAAPEGYDPRLSLGFGAFTLAVDDAPLNEGLKRAEKHARRSSQIIGDEINKGSSRAAMGLYALGNAIDDAQYGFKSIVNNIPQVAMMFGAAGIAGALGIAAVAVNQLIIHWDQLASLFQTDFIRTQAEATAELAEKTKAAADEAERLLKAQLPAHEAGAKAIAAGAIGAGGQQSLDAITDALLATTKSKITQKGNQFFEQGKFLPITEERAKTIQAAERAKIDATAKFLLGSAGTNEGSRARIEGLMNAVPGAFAGVPGFGKAIRGAAPGRMAEQEMLNRQGREGEAILKMTEETRKLAEEKRKKETEMLNKEGELGEKTLRDKMELEKEQLQRQHRMLMDQASEMKTRSIFGGTHEMINALQASNINSPQQQLVKHAKELNKKVDRLNDQIAKLRPVFQ